MRALLGRTRFLLAAILLVLVAPAPASSADGNEVAFAPGVWLGKAFYSGTYERGGMFGFANAIVEFDLTVEGDQVAGGMDVSGHGESDTAAGVGDMYFTGKLDLSGSASAVVAKGEVSFTGTADGFPISFDGPIAFGFSPTFASCTRVFGDLVPKSVKSNLPDVTASAPFVAFRALYGSQYQELLDQYQMAVNALINMLYHPEGYTLETFDDVVEQVEDLNALISELVPCVPLPADLQHSKAPTEFQALFRQIVVKVLENADNMSAQQVISLLYQGFRIGALVGDTPEIQALLDEFEDILTDKLDHAQTIGDDETVKDIAVAAKQCGMTELQEDAEATLKEMTGGS